MQRDNAAAHAETRRHFDIVAEVLRHEVRSVAEGVESLSARSRPDPPLSYEEVMRRILGRNGYSSEDTESTEK